MFLLVGKIEVWLPGFEIINADGIVSETFMPTSQTNQNG